MKTDSLSDQSPKLSELRLVVTISDGWLQNFADEKKLVIPLKEKYHLHQFQFSLFRDELLIKAPIMEKPESIVELLGKPRWDATSQRLYLDGFTIETKTKNLLIKSAGWVASKLLHEKVDRLLEEKLNDLYRSTMKKIILKDLLIPIRNQSTMNMIVQKINIQSIAFLPGKIEVEVEVSGKLKLDLKN